MMTDCGQETAAIGMGTELEGEAGLQRVAAEHLDRLDGEGLQILADRGQLPNELARHRDDVAACRVRLKEIEQLPRARPDDLRARAHRQHANRLGDDGRRIPAGIGDAPCEHRHEARDVVGEPFTKPADLVNRHDGRHVHTNARGGEGANQRARKIAACVGDGNLDVHVRSP